MKLQLLLLALFLAAPLRAQACQTPPDTTSLTLGPATLTFPEIARKLSTEGRTITCDADLRQCAAFVSLHDRDWPTLRALFQAGLNVRFEQDKKNPTRWYMERDPDIARRERDWLRRFAANCKSELMARLAAQIAANALYLDAPYAAVRTRHAQLRQEYEARRVEEAQVSVEQIAPETLQLSVQAKSLPDPQEYLALQLLRHSTPDSLLEPIRTGWTLAPVEAAGIADPDLLQALAAQASGLPYDTALPPAQQNTRFHAFGGFTFNPSSFVLQTSIVVCGRREAQEGEYLPVRLAHKPNGVLRGYEAAGIQHAGIGKDAAQWLEGEQQATRTYLAGDKAKTAFTLTPERPTTSVSQIVAAWSQNSDSEAICELLPTRESLAVGTRKSEAQLAPSSLVRLSDLFGGDAPWSLREKNGVLLVTDQFAFLDRAYAFPLAAFLTLERRWNISTLEAAQQMPATHVGRQAATSARWRALLDYTQAITPTQATAWSGAGLSDYRGRDMASLTNAYPVLLVLARTSGRDLVDLTTRLANGEPVPFPLAQVPAATLQDVTEAYRHLRRMQTRFAIPSSLDPEFATLLRTWTLQVSSSSEPNGVFPDKLPFSAALLTGETPPVSATSLTLPELQSP